jgi:hypothetical protein
MVVLKKSEYQNILHNISTYPYSYPPVSMMQEELDNYPLIYIGWAVWLIYGLPKPINEEEKASQKMLLDFLNKNLKIIED